MTAAALAGGADNLSISVDDEPDIFLDLDPISITVDEDIVNISIDPDLDIEVE